MLTKTVFQFSRHHQDRLCIFTVS